MDVDNERASRLAKRFRTTAYRELDRCASADGVLIATPLQQLIPTTLRALQMHVPILVEKPLGVNQDQLAPLRDLAKRSKARIQIGYQLRFHPKLVHVPTTGAIAFERVERDFESVWRLIEDCGVHDLDLANYLLDGRVDVKRVTESENELSAEGLSQCGRSVYWRWSVGATSRRRLSVEQFTVDFCQPSIDLLAVQLDAFITDRRIHSTRAASFEDAQEVVRLLDHIRMGTSNG